MDEMDILAGVSLFRHMPAEDLQHIAKQTEKHQYQAGEMIIREGSKGRRLFIIVTGLAEAIKNMGGETEKILGAFGPFSYFGEMALIDDMTRSASVVAREATKVLTLSWDLRKEIEKSPAMAVELLQTLSRRVRASETYIANRLGSFLPICANCKSIREVNGTWTPIEEYIRDHADTEFSHGICPACAKKLYPEFYKE